MYFDNTSIEYQLNSRQSSYKIKELYQEFQYLKKRIVTIDKKKDRHSQQKSRQQSQHNSSNSRIENILSSKSNMEFQCFDMKIRSFLKHEINNFINQYLPKMKNSIMLQLQQNQKRLQILADIMIELPKCIKIFTNSNKNSYKQCQCKLKEVKLAEIQNKYQQQINKLKTGYQSKIKLLLDQIKQLKENHTMITKDKKNYKHQQIEKNKHFQEDFFINEKQIADSSTQVSHLKTRFNSDRLNKIKNKLN